MLLQAAAAGCARSSGGCGEQAVQQWGMAAAGCFMWGTVRVKAIVLHSCCPVVLAHCVCCHAALCRALCSWLSLLTGTLITSSIVLVSCYIGMRICMCNSHLIINCLTWAQAVYMAACLPPSHHTKFIHHNKFFKSKTYLMLHTHEAGPHAPKAPQVL